jgi:hypothetical protein
MTEHREVASGFGGWGNWVECSCGWVGGPFEGHEMLPPEKDAQPLDQGCLARRRSRKWREHVCDAWGVLIGRKTVDGERR